MDTPTVSFGGDIRSPRELQHVCAVTMMARIRFEWKEQVYAVRAGMAAKTTLPFVLWSGTFTERKITGLVEHSGILCIDLDDIPVKDVEPALGEDPFTAGFFTSPSGTGLKVLFNCDPGQHSASFEWVAAYLAKEYGLTADRACRDVSRACFVSYDPEAWYDPDVEQVPQLVKPAEVRKTRTDFTADNGEERPGDAMNSSPSAMDNVVQLLEEQGWRVHRKLSDRIQMTRPEKERGVSGTVFDDGTFFSFTSSTSFEPRKGYSPFSVYTLARHGGDYRAAARALAPEPERHGPGIEAIEYFNKRPPGSEEPEGTTTTGQSDSVVEEAEDPEEESQERNLIIRPSEVDFATLQARIDEQYPVLVQNLMHQGTKTLLSSVSKAGKSWLALGLSLSVCTGSGWLGLSTRPRSVLFINAEVQELFFLSRIEWMARSLGVAIPPNFFLANTVGTGKGLADVASELEGLDIPDLGLIVLDPLYKVIAPLDERDATDMTQFLNMVDSLAERTGAAVLLSHHHRKGNLTDQSSIDKASGSGVFARDADTIITLSPHEEEDCFVFDATLRNFPRLDPFVIRQSFPAFEVAPDLDPRALRRSGPSKPKTVTVPQVLEQVPMGGIYRQDLTKALRGAVVASVEAINAGVREAQQSSIIQERDGIVYRAEDPAKDRFGI